MQENNRAENECFDLSLVLACYLEEPHLQRNVGILHSYLSATKLSYEIIFVEDASPDGTLQEAIRATAALRELGVSVQLLQNAQNRGRGASVQSGFMHARGKVVCFLDLDLEHLPDALLPMYLQIASGQYDGIIGHRLYSLWQCGLRRTVMSVVYRRLAVALLRLPISDPAAGCKMFRRQAILPVLQHAADRAWFWDTEIVARAAHAGLRLADHSIVFERNHSKTSTVRMLHDSYQSFTALLRFARMTWFGKGSSGTTQFIPNCSAVDVGETTASTKLQIHG